MSALSSPSFGSLLRRHRLAAGLTQEALAERSGLSPRAVIALEGGERRKPYRHTIQLLASALNLSPTESALLEVAAGRSAPAAETKPSGEPVRSLLLVGRTTELAALDSFLGERGGRAMVFAGEPGIGKTRLLEEARRKARESAISVLHGGAHRRSGQEPYAPLLDTLERSIHALSASQLRSSLSGCRWLARLLPELGDIADTPLPSGDVGPEQERRLVFRAVARYLVNTAGPGGTLLVLDDLQWASPDGLDLLDHLLRSAESQVRLIGAYRSTEVTGDHPLATALAGLAESGLVEQIPVEPLDGQDAVELVHVLLSRRGTAPDDPEIREIVERGGGLPFFLVSCVQGLAEATTDGRSGVPWNVAQSIRQRVAALPSGAQDVLQAAAVAGRTMDRRVVLRLGLASDEEVLKGLDAACRARLLTFDGGRVYRFTHDLIRDAVEAELGAGLRSLLHRRLGEAQEQLPAVDRHAAELAWHFQQADVPEKTLQYSLEAGDESAKVSARSEAEAHYLAALKVATYLHDAAGEAEAQEKLGLTYRSSGRYDDALAALEQAASFQRAAGHVEDEGRILTKMGWVLSQQGKPDEGIMRLRAMAEELEQTGPSAALVGLYETLYHLYSRQGWEDKALAAAEHAAQVASLVDDSAVRLRGEVDRGRALSARDRFDDALEIYERVIPAAEQIGDSDMLAAALFGAAEISMAQGNFEQSKAYRIQLVELRKRTHGPEYVAWALAWVAELHFRQGGWAEARSHYEQAAELTCDMDSHQAGWVRTARAEMRIADGTWVDAEIYLRQSTDIASQSGDRQSVPRIEALWAHLDLLHGEAGAALARLEPLAGTFELRPDELKVLAEAYLEVGKTQAAHDVVEYGSGRAARQNNLLDMCDWLRLEGMARAAQGRWDDAERAVSEAVSLSSRLSLPYPHAQALYEWGRICLERGETERAHGYLREAHAIFHRLGAEPYAERTEQLLRRPA